MSTVPEKVFDDLRALASDRVLVIDNYHGRYNPESIPRYDCVIKTQFGESIDSAMINKLFSLSPDTFFIFITSQKYPPLDPAVLSRCKIFYIPSAYSQYHSLIPPCYIDIHNKVLVREFLSLNRRTQWNRQALFQFLHKENLFDHFYFSFLAEDRFKEGGRIVYDRTNLIIGDTWYNQGLDHDQLYQKLPFRTGIDDAGSDSCYNDWSFGNVRYYQDTFCSFVNETYIDENYNPFFTEKIFKPIKYGHAFLLFSSCHALRYLHELGFETFPDIFDESYDNIENPHLRFEHLLREVLRICSLPLCELQKMHQTIIPRLIHNQDIFQNKLQDIYKREIQTVIDEIKKMIPALTT